MTMRCLLLCGALLVAAATASAESPSHQVPKSADGDLVVGLCDGETAIEVEGVKDGEMLAPEKARQVADQLMREWRRKNPNVTWDDDAALAQAGQRKPPPKEPPPGESPTKTSPRSPPEVPPAQMPPPAEQPIRMGGGETADTGATGVKKKLEADIQAGHTYGAYSERDVAIWNASTVDFVARGNRIFHDVKELGGTTGMSCDMCHPNAANTHPETYPKYQVQLGRVALLRDMINWCLENPVRAKPLPEDDERLRAMEAYIYAQRKGVALQYGKH